jgi:hypothetical protein
MVKRISDFPEYAIAYGHDRTGQAQQINFPPVSAEPREATVRKFKPGEMLNTIVNNIETLIASSGAAASTTKVQRNVRIPDNENGGKREFDVLITVSDGLRQTLTAIECKDYKRPVDVEVLEQYVKKCQSCGIHHPIIVSIRGFSKKALRGAKLKNIDCFTLREALAPNWLRDIGFSLVFTTPKLGSCEAKWQLPQEVVEGWGSGRWKFVTPFGNPFLEAFERSLEINRAGWGGFSDVRVKFFLNPDKLQILDTETDALCSPELFTIEVVLETLEHPIFVTHRKYGNELDRKTAIDSGFGSFEILGFEGSVTLIGTPASTVTGQITIKRTLNTVN